MRSTRISTRVPAVKPTGSVVKVEFEGTLYVIIDVVPFFPS